MVTALIFAGGVGVRMRSANIPKQFLKVEGKPIIAHTIEHFEYHEAVDQIVVACHKDWIGVLKEYITQYHYQKIVKIIPGGETGYQTIHGGLMEIADMGYKEDDIVLICDGVRPILSEDLISTCIADAKKFTSAVPVTESIDSVLYSEDGENCSKNFKRKNIYITQAPQGYTMKRILDAHEQAEAAGVESVSSADLLIELGQTVHIFKGIRENIKATTPEDMYTLRAAKYYEHFQQFAREELED